MLPSIVIMIADVTMTIRECYKGNIDAKTRNQLIIYKLGKGAANVAIGALVTAGLIFASGGIFFAVGVAVAAVGVAATVATNAGLDYMAQKKVMKNGKNKKIRDSEFNENYKAYKKAIKTLDMTEDCTDKQLITAKRNRLVTYYPDSDGVPAAMKAEFTQRFIGILAAYEIAHKYRLENCIGEEALIMKKLNTA